MRNLFGSWAAFITAVALVIDSFPHAIGQWVGVALAAAYVGAIGWGVGAVVDMINAAIKRLER
jgi:hypothetical protein